MTNEPNQPSKEEIEQFEQAPKPPVLAEDNTLHVDSDKEPVNSEDK